MSPSPRVMSRSPGDGTAGVKVFEELVAESGYPGTCL